MPQVTSNCMKTFDGPDTGGRSYQAFAAPEDILNALGASKLDTLIHVGLPSSMPYFFAALKISISLAFVGTVVSESIAANTGIGAMIAFADFGVGPASSTGRPLPLVGGSRPVGCGAAPR